VFFAINTNNQNNDTNNHTQKNNTNIINTTNDSYSVSNESNKIKDNKVNIKDNYDTGRIYDGYWTFLLYDDSTEEGDIVSVSIDITGKHIWTSL